MVTKRNRPARLVILALAGLAVCITFLGVFAASAAPGTYTFDGAPSGPAPAAGSVLSDWDVQVHSRDSGTWLQMEGMDAQHGADCSAPPATHHLDGAYQDAVFQCKDHFMTAINASGYGLIYLTPPQMVDFSSGTASIKFDTSTLRQSTRDWVDIWITPYEDNLTLPFDQGDVDLQGLPRQGVHVIMSAFNGESTYRCNQISNFVETEVPSFWWDSIESRLVAAGRAPSPAVRDTFELKLSTNHIKFSSPTIPGWVGCDTDMAALGFTRGVVQIGHHSYNPAKDNSGVPQTRHWDNITISPSVPLTIIRGDRRYVNDATQTVSFQSPAPSGASLRFSANGENLQISTNGGSTWTSARIQPAETNVDRFKGYFVPIPAGTTSVKVRGDATFNGPFFAQDFSIFAQSGVVGGSQPTSTPTTAATSTPTSAPTSAPTATSTTAPPTAVPTQTAPATATQAPSGTATPAPSNTTAGSRITWQGKSWYLNGANLPWNNWGCDFGCGSNGGASSASANATLDAAFAQAKANGVNVIRWWVFPGNPWQITTNASGTPTGLNAAIYPDFDAALALAAKYDIYLDLVLFNAPTAVPSGWINDATQRQALANVLAPLFAKYKTNTRILSWEVFNEPEWDIWNNKIALAPTQATVKAVAASVHANSGAKVTVGSAMLEGAGMWVGQGLDYYQAHWYDYMSSGGWCARCRDYASAKTEYKLDAPLVIGEFYAGADTDALQRFEDFYAKGFAGAWAWSLLPGKTADGMAIDLAAQKTFASRHADVGPKGGTSSSPTPTPATPSPTATPTTTPSTGSFTVTTSSSSSWLFGKTKIAVSAKVKSSAAAKALIDVEIYSPSGKKVFQQSYDNRSFKAGQTLTFTPSWTVPSNAEKGTYTIKVGVFAPGWGTLFTWSDPASTFTVR